MEEDNTPAPNPQPAKLTAADKERYRKEAVAIEAKRRKELDAVEKFARAAGMSEKAARDFTDIYRDSGEGADKAREGLETHEHFNRAPSGPPVPTEDNVADELGLSSSEKRSYSVVRLVDTLVKRHTGARWESSLETEVSDAIAKRCGRETDGFFIAGEKDLNEHGAQYRDISAGVDTTVVGTDHLAGEFIDVLRPNMLTRQLGVRVMSGLVGDVSIPRKATASAATWAGDEATTAFSESEPTFDAVTLTPQHLGLFLDVSKQFLAQATPDADNLLRDDIQSAIAVGLDDAVYEGSGSGQPQGINGATSVPTSTITAAGQPTLAELVEFETDIDSGNALDGSQNWVMTPAVRGFMRQTLLTSGVSGYMWQDGEVLGYPAFSTSQLGANSIIFGDWRQYILGTWDGVELIVDPYTNATTRLVRLVIGIMADGDVRQPASFCTDA